jgi:hypothetical protein
VFLAVLGLPLERHARHGCEVGEGELQRWLGDSVTAGNSFDAERRVGRKSRGGQK